MSARSVKLFAYRLGLEKFSIFMVHLKEKVAKLALGIGISSQQQLSMYLKKTASRKADKNAKDSIDKKVNAISK